MRAGYQVELFERSSQDMPLSAAYVAASMLAPLSEYPDSPRAVYELAQKSMQQWPSLLNELDVQYAIDGSIVVAHTQDLPLLKKFERVLRKGCLPGVSQLSQTELLDIEPEIGQRFTTGLLLEGEGWIDNRQLLRALETRCGSIRYDQSVDPSAMSANLVIDCRGFGAVGKGDGLRGVRGEVIRIRAPEVNLSRPVRLMHPRYQLYISPRADHEYVVGATELESDSDAGVSIRSALELLSAAITVHSGFAEAEILELGVGVRAAYSDNIPRVCWQDGVLCVNGLYRHGFLIAPATVEAAVEEVKESCKLSLTAIS